MLYLLERILKWRRNYIIPVDKVEFRWSYVHLRIVGDYFSRYFRTFDFGELPCTISFIHNLWSAEPKSSRMYAKLAASFIEQVLPPFFMVPRVDRFHESNNRISKYQLVEAFISFLLQLLHHKTYLCGDRIDSLEKELRHLLTILGDLSLMLCVDYDHEDEEFQKLLAEFEAVANEAGSFVHYFFFSIGPAFEKMEEDLGVVFNHIHLLKANIMEFLNLLSSISTSAYTTPKTSAVDSLHIVDSLIYDLKDLINLEDNPIADVKDQINILFQGLIFLQSCIKDIGVARPSNIGEMKESLMRIGDMAHQAEYLITSFLVGDAPLWYLINRLTEVNHKIELIGTELQKITKKYIFGGLQVAKCFGAQLSLQDNRNTEVDDGTVGFGDNERYVLDKLVGGGTKRQFISIFGMPGLGKTTLAKKLYNHPYVNCWFDKRSWCAISQIYERQNILANILIHLASELAKDEILKMGQECLVEHIYKMLKGRRYLIVMDDVWDSNVWDDLQRCFPDDGNGSRVLFTTRNKNVAPPNSTIYELPSLSRGQCWKLLEKKVFHDKPCPPELLRIGKKIAANCNGLPLAVVVIAGILSTMDRETSTWEEVQENVASYIFDAGDNSSVMQILELSFKHLPNYLKPCFLYFGAFKEDKEIPAKKLVRLWIAEGFVHKEEEKSAENVAEKYLMELIDKSLVMVAERRSDGEVKACVIHDLLRDLCLKTCEEENFIKFVKNDIYSTYEKGHRLQELKKDYPIHLQDLKKDHTNPIYCQHLRSYHGRRYTLPAFYVRDMKLLRVLYFDYDSGTRYIGIEFLISLRYLVISYFPPSIDKLVNLEYLCVHTDKTVCLPPTIVKTRKLRYIQVPSGAIYDKDCKSSHENKLEFLSSVIIRDEFKDEEILRCSPHLRKLKCFWVPLSAIEAREYRSVFEKRFYKHFDLSFLTHLASLNLAFHGKFRVNIEEIRFPPNLKKLKISGEFRMPWEKMSTIGRLKNLEILKIEHCSFHGERWDSRDGEFQNLRFLTMDVRTLIQWVVNSSEHFPKLQRLVLRHCYNLQEIPSEIGEIAALELIEVQGVCKKSLVESAKKIEQEQLDMANEEFRVIISVAFYT